MTAITGAWCAVEQTTSRRLPAGAQRECPACDHVFKGNGWDGIDAHWKARHEPIGIAYVELWRGLLECPMHHR